ncbi:MAG: hypothetical protein DKM50_12990 [Candidatus Margulisiibacteriota bacterium]|nr:MAG: hypothetical protein A2X43_11210 [Candidatus Margulisbacteria bacterium GWD2_39_127]OGI02794.1 MAG: hypothetical protein A2X42_02035 [Candidatus Margulisbacteria bacterium GWF2_38_17]OGI09319.1 MAG: hypothetical protein A2X41_09340 [Candidatus Margulisbacteria bacterium GWE2_39_32]PZM77389.1 MAG: hypothetical protein DKM50_12990 [Candidatus Margulisiibacteriota bacterium]HAR63968.1 hypothetical protein [Candidatus Margulisiibacteriota bacterium]
MRPVISILKKKSFWLVFIISYVMIFSFILYSCGYFEKFDMDIYDHYSRTYRKNVKLNSRIKVILIDDASLKSLSPELGRWPWKRSIYRDIIRFINMGNPRAIYFDIFFIEGDLDKKNDDVFAQAIKESGNVHLGMNFVDETEKSLIHETLPELINKKFSLNIRNSNEVLFKQYKSYMLPFPKLVDSTKSLPVYTFNKDSDGIHRQAEIIYKFGNHYYPSLALSALMELCNTHEVHLNKHTLKIGNFTIPLRSNGKVLLNWYPSDHEILSIGGILASWQQIIEGDINNLIVDPSIFKDSIVIIGASAVGLNDLKATPINVALAGSELHATLLSNILNHDLMLSIDKKYVIISVIIIAVITTFSIVYISHIAKYFIAVILLLCYGILSRFLFVRFNLYLPITPVLFTAVMAYLISLIYISFTETKEKLRIRRTFSKYLAPAVMHEVLRKYGDLEPEVGKKIEATILFSDIRSFTTISEYYPVELVVKLLNEYFEVMINSIHLNSGTLDKMIGDAIMAFWNSPILIEDHSLRAVETAFRMQELMVVMNEKWKKDGYPHLRIGIGINTGEAIIGNIGSSTRLDYTAIGDNVNLASRLEGLCKVYSAKIVISEFTYAYIKDIFPCRILDNVRVKGKLNPIAIYEPLKKEETHIAEGWNKIFESYLQRDWNRTELLLLAFMDTYPGDALAKIYYKRIVTYIANPPEDCWDGICILETK